MVGAESAFRLAAAKDEIRQQRADLIAREHLPSATRSERDGSADPVGVRIAGYHQIGVNLLCSFHEREEHRWILRVRDAAGNVRKIAVRFGVWPEHFDPLEPVRFKNWQHGCQSNSVQRRIQDAQVARARKRLPENSRPIAAIHFLFAEFDMP